MTLEGVAHYDPGDAILTGSRGERRRVARTVFDSSYDPVPPADTGSDGPYSKRQMVALARQLTQPLSVPTGPRGDLMHGAPGD